MSGKKIWIIDLPTIKHWPCEKLSLEEVLKCANEVTISKKCAGVTIALPYWDDDDDDDDDDLLEIILAEHKLRAGGHPHQMIVALSRKVEILEKQNKTLIEELRQQLLRYADDLEKAP